MLETETGDTSLETSTTPIQEDSTNSLIGAYYANLNAMMDLAVIGYHRGNETMSDDINIYFALHFAPPNEEIAKFKEVAVSYNASGLEVRRAKRMVGEHIQKRLSESPAFRRRYLSYEANIRNIKQRYDMLNPLQ